MRIVLVLLVAVLVPLLAQTGVTLRALIADDYERTKSQPNRLPNLSLEEIRTAEADDRAALEALHGIDRSALGNIEDRILYDVFEYELTRRLEYFRLRLYLTPYGKDPRFGVPFYDITRHLQNGQYVDQFIGLLQESKRAGMLPPKYIVRKLLGSTSRIQRLNDYLTNEYLPACPDSPSLSALHKGVAIYAEIARRSTTTSLSPAELHELGLKEVAAIRQKLIALSKRVEFKGTLDEFLTSTHGDPRFYFRTGDELLVAYRAAFNRIEPLLPKLFHRVAVRPFRIEPLPGIGASASYDIRGETVVVETSHPELRPKFEIVPVMLHEGVPGHHFQNGRARGSPEALTALRQNMAFTEGWGLYAESLGEELGLYADPYDKFGQLSMDLMRSVRLVLDTGVHSLGWTAQEAQEYFVAQTGKPEAVAQAEVARTAFPGMVLAYKVGELRLKALRQRTALRLGARFDLRTFHEAILDWGPLPLDILEARMDDCLKRPDEAVVPCMIKDL